MVAHLVEVQQPVVVQLVVVELEEEVVEMLAHKHRPCRNYLWGRRTCRPSGPSHLGRLAAFQFWAHKHRPSHNCLWGKRTGRPSKSCHLSSLEALEDRMPGSFCRHTSGRWDSK